MNCFEAELPLDICEARSLEVLSMNGLRASAGCAKSARFPFSGVLMFNIIGGTLPDCVWLMPNLVVLHMVGNGLKGDMISEIPRSSKIQDLSLSHNRLGGAIPRNVQNVNSVDLSHNQISQMYVDSEELILHDYLDLEINRLSGRLPVWKLRNVSELNVLRGNMFSCETIPANDEFENDYICGSSDLDESLIVFGSSLVAAGCLFLGMTMLVCLIADDNFLRGSESDSIRRRSQSAAMKAVWSLAAEVHQLRLYMNRNAWEVQLEKQIKNLQPIAALCKMFKTISLLFVHSFGVLMLCCLPIYVIRGLDYGEDVVYSTHTDTYTWFWTFAYMRGAVPATLIMSTWSITLGFYFYHIMIRPLLKLELDKKSSSNVGGVSIDDISCSKIHSDSISRTITPESGEVVLSWWTILSLLVNAAVSVVVNVMYILATQQPLSTEVQFFIQLSLALFRVIYSYTVFPFMTRSIVDPIANIRYRGRLLMVSNLIIPFMVTGFASPSCFQVGNNCSITIDFTL